MTRRCSSTAHPTETPGPIISLSLIVGVLLLLLLTTATPQTSDEPSRQLLFHKHHHEYHTSLSDMFFRLLFWAETVRFNPQHFEHFEDHYPTRIVTASPTPLPLPVSHVHAPFSLPSRFDYITEGGPLPNFSTAKFLKKSGTVALIVVHNGEIRLEQYYNGFKPNQRQIGMSVTKFVTMTALAVAYTEGSFPSVYAILSDYVPLLRGTVLEGLPVVNFLQMSTGTNGDSVPAVKHMIYGKSWTQFTLDATSNTNFQPGVHYSYCQCNALAMAMMILSLTGYSTFTQYVTEKIWHPLGMQDAASYILDDEGTENTWFGLSATARDLAKLGQLYLNNGMLPGGVQLVDPEWVANVSKSDENTPLPRTFDKRGFGYNVNTPRDLGLGYSDFYAIGANSQFIYMNPANNTVIVKLSQGNILGDGDNSEGHANFFRAVAAHL